MRYTLPGRAAALLALVYSLQACHSSSGAPGGDGDGGGAGPVPAQACVADDWCVGAAKLVVTPAQAYIDGVAEERLFVGTKTQQFNLGGFGINPIQNFPDPFAQFGSSLTQPAQEPVYVEPRDRDTENTYLRVLVVEEGSERVAFITLDAIGAGNLIQDGLRAAVVEASCALDWCIAEDHIVFGQTHSHAGADLQGLWGGVPREWIEKELYGGAAQAIQQAIRGRARAEARIATGETSEFNNYRRPRVNPSDDADAHLALLSFNHVGGNHPIARLMQYAAHPTSVNEDPRVPHADYIYGLAKHLERDGGTALYFNGPIADASPAGGDCGYQDPNAYQRVRCRGDALAAFALKQASRKLEPALAVRNVTATLPVTNPMFVAAGGLGSFNRYYNFTPKAVTDIPVLGEALGTVQTEIGQVATVAQTLVTRLSLGGAGGLEIATIPGEATNTFGNFIRGLVEYANPGASAMLLGLTQNSFGYILPEEEFSYVDPSGDTGFLIPYTGYEEFVSLGPLTAPLLRMQAYIPLFDAPATEYLPQYLRACSDPASQDCLLTDVALKLEYVQTSLANTCLENGAPEAFCSLLNPDTPLAAQCLSLAVLPPALCGLLGKVN